MTDSIDVPWTEDDLRDEANHIAAEERGPIVPTSAATMLPEAPASANLKLTTPNGVEIMWTLRDVDEHALAQRVGAFVQARIAAGHAISGSPRPAPNNVGAQVVGDAYANVMQRANGAAPVCPMHGTPVKASRFGGWYCSTQVGQDAYGQPQYCQQKVNA